MSYSGDLFPRERRYRRQDTARVPGPAPGRARPAPSLFRESDRPHPLLPQWEVTGDPLEGTAVTDHSFDLAAALAAAGSPSASSPEKDVRGLPIDPALAFAELARIDLATHDLDQILGRIATLAQATLPDADEVSVTLLGEGGPRTPAATGDMARGADERQYESGGPCVAAAESGSPVLVPDLMSEQRWPDYVPTAVQLGVASSLSVPLPVQRALSGAINCYSSKPHSFDDDDLALAQSFANYAGVAIANAYLYGATATHARQLEEALTNRAVIEQAKGIIMVQRRCSADEAFQTLARASQQANRKLRDIATDLVAAAQRP